MKSQGQQIVAIPRHNPKGTITMGNIIRLKPLFPPTLWPMNTLTSEQLELKQKRRAARTKGFGFLKRRMISGDEFLAGNTPKPCAKSKRNWRPKRPRVDHYQTTMTLELSPEFEHEIERAARQQGMDAPSFAIDTLRRALDIREAPKAKKETRSFGFLRGQISGSDAFLEERHAEAQREMSKEPTA